MKTKLIIPAILALSLLLASCASTSATSSVKPYPSNLCLVTGNKLGSMGDPVSFVHEGQEIKVCCQPCVPKFNENPTKFLANIN